MFKLNDLKSILKACVTNILVLVGKEKALKFLIKLSDISLNLADSVSIRLNNGIHPKHALMKYHDFFLDHIDPADTVLDIGCGNGVLSYHLAKKCKEVVGVDIDRNNILFAQTHFSNMASNLEFICDDATKLSFESKYNAIILSNVLEHIEERMDLLEKIKGNSSRLLIRVPVYDRSYWIPLKQELKMDWRSDKTHFIEYTEESIKNEIEQGGWKIKEIKRKWGEFYIVAELE